MNVWATWCPPCIYEMPSMEKLYPNFKSESLTILAVSIDSVGAKAVAPFMKKHNLNFLALIDPTGNIKATYEINSIPQSFIINKKGNMVKKFIGPIDWSTPEMFRFFRDLISNSHNSKKNEHVIRSETTEDSCL